MTITPINAIETKSQAVEFVASVLQFTPSLLSPDFQVAMSLSRRFDISAKDLLEYRRNLEKRS